jgi:hypothetical protein
MTYMLEVSSAVVCIIYVSLFLYWFIKVTSFFLRSWK